MQTSGFLGLKEKLLYLGQIRKKQSIGLEILYRDFYLRTDLRSMVQATEVTKGHGQHSGFGDIR